MVLSEDQRFLIHGRDLGILPSDWTLNFRFGEEMEAQCLSPPGGLSPLHRDAVPQSEKDLSMWVWQHQTASEKRNKSQGLGYLFSLWLLPNHKAIISLQLLLLPHNTLDSNTTLWLSVYFPYFNKLSVALCTLQITTHLKLYHTPVFGGLTAYPWFIQICIISPQDQGLHPINIR